MVKKKENGFVFVPIFLFRISRKHRAVNKTTRFGDGLSVAKHVQGLYSELLIKKPSFLYAIRYQEGFVIQIDHAY